MVGTTIGFSLSSKFSVRSSSSGIWKVAGGRVPTSFRSYRQHVIRAVPEDSNNDTPPMRAAETVVSIPMGKDIKPFECALRPLFVKSEFFTVTYSIPFGLNVEKPPKEFPAPIVTKDSQQEGGEKAGDVLRATTCWSQGFSAAGATSDIMMFAGNVKWRKSVFFTAGAPWQETVDALLSNTAERSDEVTLVFEREIE